MVLNNTDRLKGWQCLAAPVAYKPQKKTKRKDNFGIQWTSLA